MILTRCTLTFPGTTTNAYTDMGGTWLKCAIGTSAKVGKNNSYYIDLEKDFGSRLKNLGLLVEL